MIHEKSRNSLKDVPISAAITASACPLRLYLDRESGTGRSVSGRYTVCKQISAHLGGPLDADRIWEETTVVDPSIDPGLRSFMDVCLYHCQNGGPWQPQKDMDVPVRFEALRIFGLVDKLHDGEPYFSIVRGVGAPPVGVYSSDRLRVTGYMLCLSEMLGEEIPFGAVEYIPDGLVRYCTPQPLDRRRFLRALGEARKIMAGEIPERPSRPPCIHCTHKERCVPGGRRLSELI